MLSLLPAWSACPPGTSLGQGRRMSTWQHWWLLHHTLSFPALLCLRHRDSEKQKSLVKMVAERKKLWLYIHQGCKLTPCLYPNNAGKSTQTNELLWQWLHIPCHHSLHPSDTEENSLSRAAPSGDTKAATLNTSAWSSHTKWKRSTA